MSNDYDKDLQRFLDGESDVSRAYAQIPREEPGEALDERILAAARREAARPRRPAWMVPAALAATLMLAVSLSWQQLRAPATVANGEADAPEAPDAAVAANDLRQSPAQAQRGEGEVGSRLEAAPTGSAGGAESAGSAGGAGRLGGGADAGDDVAIAGKIGPRQAVTARRAAPEPALTGADADALNSRIAESNASQRLAHSEPQAAPDSGFAPAPPVAQQADGNHVERVYASPDDVRRRSARPGQRRSMSSSASAMAMAKALPEDLREDPARFLDVIRAVHDRGEVSDAHVLLREFRERHPDYPLPEDFPLAEPALEDAEASRPSPAPPDSE